MSVSGIGGGSTPYIGGAPSTKTAAPDAATEFLNYMKESPAQRMMDSWLQAHGLTQADLDKMKPEERDKIVQQMKQDIEEKIKEKNEAASSKAGDPKRVDISV